MKIAIILLLMIIPSSAFGLSQSGERVEVDLMPGDSSTFQYGLMSDKKGPVTIYLRAVGECNEFLDFKKQVVLERGKISMIDVTISIPENHAIDLYCEPIIVSTERGETGGATVINLEIIKRVRIAIGDPEIREIIKEKPDVVKEEKPIEKPKEQSSFTITQDVPVDLKPEPIPEPVPECGAGTKLVNGFCKVMKQHPIDDTNGGGCLIATATYGTELAPQVQLLREIRDNQLMNTDYGISFMTGFNQLYYSFSPHIADMERQNPLFQEAVKLFITPMISSLSIMSLADNSDKVLGLGISVIMLNLGIYIVAPTLILVKASRTLINKNGLFNK